MKNNYFPRLFLNEKVSILSFKNYCASDLYFNFPIMSITGNAESEKNI